MRSIIELGFSDFPNNETVTPSALEFGELEVLVISKV
jgi:hypothetical protein